MQATLNMRPVFLQCSRFGNLLTAERITDLGVLTGGWVTF
jgi:hypothetical protein